MCDTIPNPPPTGYPFPHACDHGRPRLRPSDWTRATVECTVSDLNPGALRAMRAHLDNYELGDLLSESTLCCQTTSKRKKTGWLERLFKKPDEVMYQAVVLTPEWLIWCVAGPRYGAAAMSARLAELEVTVYVPTLIEDHGLYVRAQWTDTSKRSQTFLPLGSGGTADKLERVLKESVTKARE